MPLSGRPMTRACEFRIPSRHPRGAAEGDVILHLVLLGLGGAVLGGVSVAALLLRGGRPLRALLLTVAVSVAAYLGATATDTWPDRALALLSVVGASLVSLGAFLGRRGSTAFRDDALSDAEARRSKTGDDLLVLVLGPRGSGKTALVDGVARAVGSHPTVGLQLVRPARNWEGDGTRLTELVLQIGSDLRTLRFWETRSIPGSEGSLLSTLRDFDCVVVIIDPTRLAGVADDFPGHLSPPELRYDANRLILSLVEAIPNGHTPLVLAALTKSDLLRFAVTPALVRFPIAVGPSWHQQLSTMLQPDRWALLDALEVRLAYARTARFDWGQGSPVFTFGLQSQAFDSFGHAELFKAIMHALTSRTPGYRCPGCISSDTQRRSCGATRGSRQRLSARFLDPPLPQVGY